METKNKLIRSILAVFEIIYYLLSFSFDLTFGGRTLKTMWIILTLSSWLIIGNLYYTLLFMSLFVVLMIFISSIMIILFACMFSRNRD